MEVSGAVQGVGFRPFVYRLANELGLAGWVVNDTRGVFVEVEGDEATAEAFASRLASEAPPRARVESVRRAWLEPSGFAEFVIRKSDSGGEKSAVVLPDVATCAECLAETRDPADRRHAYPFTNCTNCGPRFSILRDLPYDRPNTTMARFAMCAACQAEYDDPVSRRFHAQPNACPACGPRVQAWDPSGGVLARDGAALARAAAALRAGSVVAVKGIGGFHLMVDARSDAALARLRERKQREEKPLALMVADVAGARALCRVTEVEEPLLVSAEAPIVLLKKTAASGVVSPLVAPGMPNLGVMLPATPLHHLLMAELGFPLVATSGNRSEEPIATDEREAVARLGGMADLFLVNDRPIERHVDDSVVRVAAGAPRFLRRARGFAPLPVGAPRDLPPLLAVGGHLKNVVALARGRRVFLSQHIGDLATPEALGAFERVIADFRRLYAIEPAAVAHDLHPGYASTEWALGSGLATIAVQHHHAHLASCLFENGASGPALGVTWDGTGHGTDGTVWGGELLVGDAREYVRVGHLRPFRLPGGEAAVREPRRIALALLFEFLGEEALGRDDLPAIASFTAAERGVLGRMLATGLNAPITTSAGRVFDGVAALLGLFPKTSFEGQAAMALEAIADLAETGSYPLPLVEAPRGASTFPPASTFPLDGADDARAAPFRLDWGPLVEAILLDVRRGVAPAVASTRFHNALVDAIVVAARRVGLERVALSGGCFQNALLLERTASRLAAAGFLPLLHRQVPANDGGLALGQIAVAATRLM